MKKEKKSRAAVSRLLAKNCEMSMAEASRLLNEVLSVISKELESGNEIELRGFGAFRLSLRKARDYRNPRTGKIVKVPARNVVTFKPSQDLREKTAKRKK